MLEPGRALAHYEIVSLLGRGGMGEVYLARDRKLEREVALKLLPEELAGDRERRERFEREARAVAALQHPNIVTLHAIEEADGLSFLVMERVDGRPLSEAIPAAGLPLERFLQIAVELADAVAAAHARGVTHRDLKPGNVLLDTAGRVRVLDFGLAKVSAVQGLGAASIEPTEALTGEGRVLGTVAYMSPEQVEGRPVDPRSDIFSLGVVLYEMATGARPFDGDTDMSVLTAILRDEPVAVTERNRRLPRDVGRIVKRCLQKKPEQRYQSALDLKHDLAELRQALASGELAAHAEPAPAARPAGRVPRLLLGAAVALALGLGAWWLAGRLTGPDRSPAEPAYKVRRLTPRGNPGTVAVSPDGRYVAYESEGAGGRSLRLQQVASGSDLELVPPAGWNVNFTELEFTPDGEFVRYAQNVSGASKTLWELPVLGGTPRRLLDGILVGPAISPDGERVAFVPGSDMSQRWQKLDAVALAGGVPRRLAELSGEADFEDLAWSPDGRNLALVVTDAQGYHLALLPAEGGELSFLPTRFAGIRDVQWSPDGRALVLAASDGAFFQLWRVEVESGTRRRLIHDSSEYMASSLTADGRLLATVRNELRSQIWIVPLDDPRRPRPVRTTSGRADGADAIAWLDNQTLVYAAPVAIDWDLFLAPAEGGEAVRLTTTGAAIPAASRNGRIAFLSGWRSDPQVGIYTVERDGSGLRRLTSLERFATRPSLSPDGEWLFYQRLGEDGLELVRRPWQGGEPVVVFDGNAHLVSFSPDGSRLAVHARNADTASWQTVIHPADFGPPLAALDVHSESFSPWDSDRSLLIARTVDGVGNLYRVDVETGSEEQVTFFADERILALEVSPDLTRVAVARGELVNDLLLIEGL